ncbi:hypothetical protein CCP2SC5_940008 [Azospirillaceae bacterium]
MSWKFESSPGHQIHSFQFVLKRLSHYELLSGMNILRDKSEQAGR